MNNEVTITTKQIKQAIDDLVDERDELQDKVYKLQEKLNQLETNKELIDDLIKEGLVEKVDE